MPDSVVPPPWQPRWEPLSPQYLQKVLALAVHHLALAPALEEPLELHEEQEEALPELLRLLHQQVLLLAPELLF